MEVTNIKLMDDTFKADFNVDFREKVIKEVTSAEFFMLDGDLVFQFMVRLEGDNYKFARTYIKFTKVRSTDEHNYTMRVLFYGEITKDEIINTINAWQQLCFTSGSSWKFSVSAKVQMPMNKYAPPVTPPTIPGAFVAMHDDEEFTDFELRGVDGGVRVHRAMLAASSDVLRRKLVGEWSEATHGLVDLPDVSASTLKHLKAYIYMNVLPDSGLEQLLLLASPYKMLDLEQQCVHRIVSTLSGENAVNLIEFATKHKLMALLFNLLEHVQHGKLKVKEIQDHHNTAK